jgi:hypothetical protein
MGQGRGSGDNEEWSTTDIHRGGAPDTGQCITPIGCRERESHLGARLQALVAGGADARVSNGAGGRLHTFTRVAHERLGEGWRDPGGVVWYSRSSEAMTYALAQKYCAERGGRMPVSADFERLGRYLGARLNTDGDKARYESWCYTPQILPELRHYHWSSAVGVFDGSTGEFRNTRLLKQEFRCVTDAATAR